MGIHFNTDKMKGIGTIRKTQVNMHKIKNNEWDPWNPYNDRLRYSEADEIFKDKTTIILEDK